MKYFTALLLFVLTFTSFTVNAHTIAPVNQHVENYIVIDNAAEYPDYNFYATSNGIALEGNISESTTLVLEGNYIDSTASINSIIAVKKNNQDDIVYTADIQDNCGSSCFSINANSRLIVTSTLELHYINIIPNESGIVKRTQIIHIDSLTDGAMVARVLDVLLENDDKAVKSLVSTEDYDIISVSQKSLGILIIGVLVVCIVVAGILFTKKTWKR